MTTAPQPKKRVSRKGLELIKSFEGFRRRAARLPNGRFVVGYGHIRSTREGAEIAPEDAEALLRYDLLPIEAAINEWALAPLTQNQFDALVSFAFNIGLASFRRSDVLRRINEGDLLRASAAMDTWRRVDLDGEPVIVDALVRRRAVEKALFLTPPEGQVPAPSAVLRPRVDTEAFSSVLLRRPEELETPLDGDDAVALRAETDEDDAQLDEPELDLESELEPEPELEPESELEPAPELDFEPEPEFQPEVVVSETTLIVPAGPDPELEPEIVITETTVFVAPEDGPGDEPEEGREAEDETGFAPDADADAAVTPETGAEPDAEPDAVLDAERASEPESADAPVADAASEEDEEPEEELSAAQAAAAAVFARLSEILAQDRDDEESDEEASADLSGLTLDPEPETADGAFLQAPPSPEETQGAGFPEMDEAALVSFEAEAPASDMAFAPESEADLQPFPEDGVLPPVIEPEEQAEFDSAYIDEEDLDTGSAPAPAPAGEQWDQRSGAQPTQGDAHALSEPLEEENRAGMLMFLALAGMALVIGGLVSFARPGADEAGSGWTWVLGTAGVLLISLAAWIATAPKDGDDASQD